MKYIQLFALLGLIALVSSCNKGPNFDAMAKEMCTCMTPMADLYSKVKDLSQSGDTETLQGMMAQMEKTAEEAETCTGKLQEKYGELDGEAEQKAQAALEKACPDVAAMINEMDAEY